MPRMKLTDLDADELEEAEYNDADFGSDYEGEQPPADTVLPGYIEKMWLGSTSNDDDMLIVIWKADETAGEYEGLPVWDYLALTKEAKFRWAPFCESVGLTIKEIKNNLFVVDEDGDNVGLVVQKIGKWEPGQDSDEAYCNIITKREQYPPGSGQWRTKVKKYLVYEAGDAEAQDEEEPEEIEAEEQEEPEEKPARGSASRRRAPAKAETEPAAKAPARRTTRTATAAKPAAAKAPARGRGRTATRGDADDPPF